jgi:hypothetical protein
MLLGLAMLLATSSICPGVPSKVNPSDWVTAEDYCPLKDTHLSAQQRADIIRLAPMEDDEDGKDEASRLNVSEAHLGIDTATQVAVWEVDSSQNSSILVFSLTRDHAVLILSGGETHDGYYRRLDAVHNGMHDFATSSFSGGAGEYQNFYTYYQFDGTRYRPAYCRSSTVKDDKGEVWDGPPHPCAR